MSGFIGFVVMVALALFFFFGKDILWDWNENRLERQGINPLAIERTDKWDQTQDLYGLLCTILAFVALAFF